MRLKGKSAIVTGAASGIGKEIALVLAREGAKVAIADLNKAAADATADELRKLGGEAIGVAMDVSSEQAVDAGVIATVAAFGGVSGLPEFPQRVRAEVAALLFVGLAGCAAESTPRRGG